MVALPPAALPPEFLTTEEVLVLCGIDDSTVINGLIQDMLSQPEGIRHLQDFEQDETLRKITSRPRRL